MERDSMTSTTVLHTEFRALLARSFTTQADFARLAGVTNRAVNEWANGRQQTPKWAVQLAIAIDCLCVMDMDDVLREPPIFDWWETLGVSGTASPQVVAAARGRLAKRYHPDVGGPTAIMQRINNAVDAARKATKQ